MGCGLLTSYLFLFIVRSPLPPRISELTRCGAQGFYKATYKKPVVAGKKPTTAIADFKKAQ